MSSDIPEIYFLFLLNAFQKSSLDSKAEISLIEFEMFQIKTTFDL